MLTVSSDAIKRTQEQANASWIEYLYNLRIYNVRNAFQKQNFNLSEALKELRELKIFVSDKSHILGRLSSKHGEIAEHCQVNISNARNLIQGFDREYSFENVGRIAPEDYLKGGLFRQLKFYNGPKGTIKAIIKHFKTYPSFVKDGGAYDIPKDQYKEIKRVMDLYTSNRRSRLSKEDMSLVRAVLKMQDETGLKFDENINSAVVGYEDVQLYRIDSTIEKEEESIQNSDYSRRKEIVNTNKPSIKEGIDVSIKSAFIEGGVSLVLAYIKKRKEGKDITQFNDDDWKELGIEFGESTIKGGVRGGTIYVLTHYTATPACIASAYVTAAFGICETLSQYRKGLIDSETFIIQCEALSLETAISALSSLAGQVLIPIPVLGAVIGNISGEVIYGVCKDKCSNKELSIIKKDMDRIHRNKEQLEKEFSYYLKALDSEFAHFETIEELAFNEDANIACMASIRLAEMVGVEDSKILRSDEDLRHFLED